MKAIKRVVHYVCPDCGYDQHESEKQARACCDAKLHERREKRQAREKKAVLGKARVRIGRVQNVWGRTVRSAFCKCPKCKSLIAVRVPKNDEYSVRAPKPKAVLEARAIGLCKAQLSRHLGSFSCR